MSTIPEEIKNKLFKITQNLHDDLIEGEKSNKYSDDIVIDKLVRYTKAKNEICRYFRTYYVAYTSLMPHFTPFHKSIYGINGEYPTEQASSLQNITLQLPYATEPTSIRITIDIRAIKNNTGINYSVAPLALDIIQESEMLSFFDYKFFEDKQMDNLTKKDLLLIKVEESNIVDFIEKAFDRAIKHIDNVFASGFRIDGDEHNLLVTPNGYVATNFLRFIKEIKDELVYSVKFEKLPRSFTNKFNNFNDSNWIELLKETEKVKLMEELMRKLPSDNKEKSKGKI